MGCVLKGCRLGGDKSCADGLNSRCCHGGPRTERAGQLGAVGRPGGPHSAVILAALPVVALSPLSSGHRLPIRSLALDEDHIG